MSTTFAHRYGIFNSGRFPVTRTCHSWRRHLPVEESMDRRTQAGHMETRNTSYTEVSMAPTSACRSVNPGVGDRDCCRDAGCTGSGPTLTCSRSFRVSAYLTFLFLSPSISPNQPLAPNLILLIMSVAWPLLTMSAVNWSFIGLILFMKASCASEAGDFLHACP